MHVPELAWPRSTGKDEVQVLADLMTESPRVHRSNGGAVEACPLALQSTVRLPLVAAAPFQNTAPSTIAVEDGAFPNRPPMFIHST